MRIRPFELERYFAEHEFSTPYLMCCSDCESMSVGELLAMEPGSADEFQNLWLGYTESPGHPALREQIAGLYSGISSDQVLVYAGGEEPIFSTMNVLLEKGDHAIVHYPCYQSLMEVARAIGCQVTLWEAHEDANWALDLDFLKSSIRPNTRLVVVNCPHNPTGYLMGRDEFGELVGLSQKHGFAIFSDEVYRLLEYDEADRLPALCEIDDYGLSLGVMSKSFGLAGLRIGWVVTRNAGLFERLAAFKDYTTICNSAPSEFLATVALKHKDRIVGRNLGIIKQNLAVLDAFFARHADRFSWVAPKAGPIAFPSLKEGDVESFCHDLLTRTGVLLLPGTVYDPASRNFRVGFGRGNLDVCVQKLEQYVHGSV